MIFVHERHEISKPSILIVFFMDKYVRNGFIARFVTFYAYKYLETLSQGSSIPVLHWSMLIPTDTRRITFI